MEDEMNESGIALEALKEMKRVLSKAMTKLPEVAASEGEAEPVSPDDVTPEPLPEVGDAMVMEEEEPELVGGKMTVMESIVPKTMPKAPPPSKPPGKSKKGY